MMLDKALCGIDMGNMENQKVGKNPPDSKEYKANMRYYGADKVMNTSDVVDLACRRILEERKEQWALNPALSPIDSIKVYGAYSTVHSTLYGIGIALDPEIKRKENPKAAKEVYSILQNVVDLVPQLEKITADQKAPSQAIAEIFDASRALRRQAISKQLIQAGELPDRQKLILELSGHVENDLN